MSEEKNTDVITKTSEKIREKIKDPKRVAAGKRLVEFNKKAKEGKIIQIKEEEEENESKEEPKSFFPSLGQISVVLGIGLTLINIF